MAQAAQVAVNPDAPVNECVQVRLLYMCLL